jgi:signal transduction histidine kinase
MGLSLFSLLILIAIAVLGYLCFLLRKWLIEKAPFTQEIPSAAFEIKIVGTQAPQFIFATERFLYFVGLDRTQLQTQSKAFFNLIYPEDQSHFLDAVADASKARKDLYWEGRMNCKGQIRQVVFEAKPKLFVPGPLHYQGVLTDLSPLKNALADNAILERETLKILRELPIPHMWTSLNRDGQTLFVNAKFTEIFGYQMSDLPTISDWFRLAYPNPKYRNEVLDWWNQALPKAVNLHQVIPSREAKIRTNSGQLLDVLISETVVEASLCLSFLDLTKRKQAEGVALSLTENIPMGTYAMEVTAENSMRFTFLSKRFLQMFDMEKEAALADPNITFSRIHPDDYQDFISLYLECIQEKRAFNWEGRVQIQGATYWFEIEAVPRTLSEGMTLWEGVVADLTSKKEIEKRNLEQAIEINAAQQELLRLKEVEGLNASLKQTIKEKNRLLKSMTTAFKANSMGNMMRSIAHEINNPLGAISLSAELLQIELNKLQKLVSNQSFGPLSDLTSAILADSQRAGGVVARLRKLFVYGDEVFEEFDLSATVNDVCLLLDKELSEHEISLHKSVPSGCRIKGDNGQIQMVVLNAVNNAMDALQQLPGGRQLSINLIQKGKETILEFLDNGPGFPEEFLKKGLGLFHTTKKGGMGVGLWLSKTILENHGGKLEIRNRKEGGARIALHFAQVINPINLELFERHAQ